MKWFDQLSISNVENFIFVAVILSFSIRFITPVTL